MSGQVMVSSGGCSLFFFFLTIPILLITRRAALGDLGRASHSCDLCPGGPRGLWIRGHWLIENYTCFCCYLHWRKGHALLHSFPLSLSKSLSCLFLHQFKKKEIHSQAWWLGPITPATQEAATGRLKIQGLLWILLKELQVHLRHLVRPCLKVQARKWKMNMYLSGRICV